MDFVGQIPGIADFGQDGENGFPGDIAQEGQGVVVGGAQVVIDVRGLQALSQAAQAFRLVLMAQIGVAKVPAGADRFAVAGVDLRDEPFGRRAPAGAAV